MYNSPDYKSYHLCIVVNQVYIFSEDLVTFLNPISGVMVSVLVLSAVMGAIPNHVKSKTMKLVFVDSMLSTQH